MLKKARKNLFIESCIVLIPLVLILFACSLCVPKQAFADKAPDTWIRYGTHSGRVFEKNGIITHTTDETKYRAEDFNSYIKNIKIKEWYIDDIKRELDPSYDDYRTIKITYDVNNDWTFSALKVKFDLTFYSKNGEQIYKLKANEWEWETSYFNREDYFQTELYLPNLNNEKYHYGSIEYLLSEGGWFEVSDVYIGID